MKRYFLFVFLSVFLVPQLYAGDLDIKFENNFAQSEFEALTEELGAVISYRPLAPASPLGITGFDAGVEVSVLDIDSESSFWSKAVTGADPPSSILIPKLHVQKGLPFGFDIGVVYSAIPGSNISYAGAELKYAFIGGNLVMPALAVRGSYTTILGVDELEISTFGVDITASKGVAMFTPYIGVGQTFVSASETSDTPGLSLKDVDVSLTHAYAGLKFSLLIINFVGEADFGKVNTYSLRANIGLDLF